MKDVAAAIFTLLKHTGKILTAVRNLIFNLIFFSLLIFIGLSLFITEKSAVQDSSALILNINGDIVEQRQRTDPFGELLEDTFGFSNLPQETLLKDIIDSIDAAAEDNRIKAILLDLGDMGRSSLNHLRDIGLALTRFKQSGKTVVAAEDFYTQNMYYLASFADSVFLDPSGVVDLHGLASYRLYFKDALEKLKINYHVFRVGAFKSALEPVTRNSMSEEAKEQNSLWLNAIWQHFKEEILARRAIDRQTLEAYTNNISSLLSKYGGDTAQLALQTRLVDDLKTRQQLRSYLAELTGDDPSGNFTYVSLREYLKEVHNLPQETENRDSVGIIIAQGNILTGEQPPGVIGSDSLIQLIHNARNDAQVKAVVLRIDSGGGSVVASEIIRSELLELKKSGKTLVVSMGSMAASGGYWIAADADEIWAHPTTLTGSIGIFGAIPTFEKSLAHLGIYSDGLGTTNLAAGIDVTQPLSAEIKEAMQMSIEHGYRKFVEIVANGRGISPDRMEQIAEGRVFDGITANKIGLVDNLGTIDDAVSAAAALEGLDNYSIKYITASSSFSEKLLENLQQNIQAFFPDLKLPGYIADKIRLISKTASELPLFQDPRGIYAHCLINYL